METIEKRKKQETKIVNKILSDAMINKDTTYHGNPLLKGPREQVALTKDHILEIAKCKEDPIYFAENYIKIVNVDKGLIPIELYPYQRKLLQGLKDNRYSIILSCRQSGKCVCYDTIITVKNKNYNNGEPFKISIGKFYDWILFNKIYNSTSI